MARQAVAILILTLIYSVTSDAVLVAKIIASDADFLNEVMREPGFLLYFSAIFLGPVIEEFVFRGPVLLAIKEQAKKYTLWIIAAVSTFANKKTENLGSPVS